MSSRDSAFRNVVRLRSRDFFRRKFLIFSTSPKQVDKGDCRQRFQASIPFSPTKPPFSDPASAVVINWNRISLLGLSLFTFQKLPDAASALALPSVRRP